MLKTFKVWQRSYDTWTGNGISTNTKYLEDMDNLINAHAKDNKLKVKNINYSMVNRNIEHGGKSYNVQRNTYFVAAVIFRPKRWFEWA